MSNQTAVGSLTYTYDSARRPTQLGGTWARTGLPQAVTDASYDAANRLTRWGEGNLSYDANGNLMSDGATSFTWNSRNQLIGLFGAEQASYQYDADGRRASRSIGGESVAYLYDELDAVQELNSGTVVGNILRGNELDELFERSDSAGVSFPLANSLGSIIAETDNASLIAGRYDYEPYGRTSVIGSGHLSSAQFTGREPDAGGIYYYRARYYSPQLHRFISEDPTASSSYAYADGNPVTLTDPLGLFSIDPSCLCPDLSEQLRRAETWAMQGAPRIQQKSMRECIQKKLKEGKVKCGGEKMREGIEAG
jgi:RHS repeat-associated protein